jgi:hypothetical protein
MNGFEKHNIKHSSPSAINMYGNCAGAWSARYLFGRKFSFGNAARAGVLAEDAVRAVLVGSMTRDEAINRARDTYKAATILTGTDADKKRGEAIEGMIDNALEVLFPYGKPCFENASDFNGQNEIELICNGDGWKLPIKGYLDFLYPSQELLIDLKTTMKMPSKMSDEHILQGVIYKKATGMDVKFLYVTGKKSHMFDITQEQVDEWLPRIKAILNRQEKMLRLDADMIKEIVPVNKGSYYWGVEDAYIASELYGI